MNPSFDSVDLVDYAPAEMLDSPDLRTTRERLPDVEGEFFQVSPSGGREVVVRGVLASSSQASGDLAAADLKTKVRSRQDEVGQVGTYQGTDGVQYAASLLVAYRQVGPVSVSPAGTAFQALIEVEARILTQP